MKKSLVWLFLIISCFLFNTAFAYQELIDECGIITLSYPDNCIVFESELGNTYLIDSSFGFQIGTKVHLIGVNDYDISSYCGGYNWGYLEIIDIKFCPSCYGLRGNIDYDHGDNIDISDIVEYVDFMFGDDYPGLQNEDEADVNADGQIDISDIVMIIDYVINSDYSAEPLPCDNMEFPSFGGWTMYRYINYTEIDDSGLLVLDARSDWFDGFVAWEIHENYATDISGGLITGNSVYFTIDYGPDVFDGTIYYFGVFENGIIEGYWWGGMPSNIALRDQRFKMIKN